jgi:hypothetical protein
VETVYGQWVDMDIALEGAEHEPDVMASICACLLVEQGKEYEGYQKTRERFETLNVTMAMRLTAFFLSTSERLRTAIALSTSRRVMSLQHALDRVATASMPITKDGTGPSQPPDARPYSMRSLDLSGEG